MRADRGTQETDGVVMRSFAVYVPEGRRSADEIARETGGRWTPQAVREKLGIEEIAVPGPRDGVQEMGARAATRCLERAGVAPESVDAILCIGDELREYPMTTSGIWIQERIGARRAWALDVMQKCSTFPAGLRLARALIRSEPDVHRVLLCGGYRNGDCIDYRNPRVSFMYNLAPAGGAALVERGSEGHRLLGVSLITDGELARHVLAHHGGTESPVTPENAAEAARCLDVTDQEGMRRLLGERSLPNFVRVVRESVAEAGLGVEDIDYLALLHMKRSGHHAILEALGLRPEQSIYLSRYGHTGQFDQLLSLELATRQGRLRRGDVVAAVGAGIGYSWGAVAFRWGECP